MSSKSPSGGESDDLSPPQETRVKINVLPASRQRDNMANVSTLNARSSRQALGQGNDPRTAVALATPDVSMSSEAENHRGTKKNTQNMVAR